MKLLVQVRSISTVLLFLGALVSGTNARVRAEVPSATSLLQGAARAERNVAFSATETVERPGSPEARMRIAHDDARRRIDYLAPDVRRGDVVVDNGKNVWIYLRRENLAVQTVSRPMREPAVRGAGARVVGVGSIDNRLTWMVEIERAGMLRRLWIDQKNFVLLRREIRRGEALIENSVLSNVRFGSPDVSFAWSPPRGAQVTRSEGTFFGNVNGARRIGWLRFPTTVPGGFTFESAIVDEKKGEAWLRFSGARRFSIFQSKGAQSDLPLQKVDGAWFLARGGNRFVIVGLDDGQTAKLAAGL
jgi:outer membrane lipoprotein-sorting protein